MTFSTEGPDRYADGTPVLDGEYYALVYQTTAAGDVAFTRTGVPVDSTAASVMRALPRAKGGRCPSTTFAIDTADLPKLTAKGVKVLRLYLFDTRVYSGGVAVVGGTNCVQAASAVTATCKVTNGSTTGTLATSFTSTALGEEAVQPRITGITIVDGQVKLTVEDTMAGVNYTVSDPISGKSFSNLTPVTGQPGGCVTFSIPCSEASSGFFRVERK